MQSLKSIIEYIQEQLTNALSKSSRTSLKCNEEFRTTQASHLLCNGLIGVDWASNTLR